MIQEKIFKMFPDVRNGYFKLIDVLCNQHYTETDLNKIKPVAKRIQINNLITTILDSIERFTFKELSAQDIQELKKCFLNKDIEEIENIEEIKKINVNDWFRNCIAHAHYTVDSNAENIQFKKGDFSYDINLEELSNIANRLLRFAHARSPWEELPFNGVKLNEFINNIISQEETIDGNADMLATLVQSYNIYHAFLYEKAIQEKEQKKFVDHYENKMKLSLDLPYINQVKDQEPLNISFDTLKFEELTQRSRADLIYFMMTSEYRTEAIEFLKGKNDDIEDDKEIIKKIYAMYLSSCPEYKDIIENTFGSDGDVTQYIVKNVSEQDYENYNDIIEFMIRKMPKSGRIENWGIMPKNKELLHGFEQESSLHEEQDSFSFIYPPMDVLVTKGTKKELFQRYIIASSREIQDEFNTLEITENKVITLTEFIFFTASNTELVERYMELPENIREFAKLIQEIREKNPDIELGQIFGNIMKSKDNKKLRDEVSNFYKDVPEDLKKEYVISKMREYSKENEVELAYRNLLFLLYSYGIDEGLLEDKKELDFKVTFNSNETNIADKEKLSRMRELGKIFDFKDTSEQLHTDFTELLTHIRNSSIHAFTEVDLSGVSKKDFVVRKNDTFKDTPSDKIDLSSIIFNFQDYNPKTKETSFLLTNIPLDQAIEVIDLASDKLILREKEKSGEDDTDGR